MMSNAELLNIKGGIDKVITGIIIIVVIFIIGVFDGYSNPTGCRR